MGKKASDNIKYYSNANGPVIGVVKRDVIEKDGLYFKNIDGTGEVSKVNDWRLSSEERAKAYAYRDAVGNYYEMNFGLAY